MANDTITQAKLKSLLNYNSDTGIFTWKVSIGRVKVGAIAGGLDSYGYITIRVDGGAYKAHRLAFLYISGEWPIDQVDHKNHVRNDNSWGNLRQADNSLNQKNRAMNNNNTSGCAGVVWYKPYNKWLAQIQVNGKRKHLGYFVTYFAAVYAKHAANIKYDFHPLHGLEKQIG